MFSLLAVNISLLNQKSILSAFLYPAEPLLSLLRMFAPTHTESFARLLPNPTQLITCCECSPLPPTWYTNTVILFIIEMIEQ